MIEELTPSEKLERLARFTEQTRGLIRCVRHAAGVSEEPLRLRLGKLVERRLQEGGLAQRNFSGVYVNEMFHRPLQKVIEQRLQQIRQAKEHEEALAEEKTETKKESEEDKFDFSVLIY